MAQDISTPDYYELNQINFDGTSYQKNGAVELGKFDRETSYVSETLIDLDLSGVPAGSIIDAVKLEFDIVSNSIDAPGTMVPTVREQNKGAWTDNGSTEPIYDTFAFTAWPAGVATGTTVTSSTSGGTTITVASTAAFIALIQDILDGVKPNDGIMLTGNTSFFSWFVTIDTITITIDFTSPRRVINVT